VREGVVYLDADGDRWTLVKEFDGPHADPEMGYSTALGCFTTTPEHLPAVTAEFGPFSEAEPSRG
jgi:hypothetical protein